ncbi:hypothetical protein [Caenispirillum bisanense]|uniref:Uncharacterized protein n=1 Tax=Caenispirillum bisanense TaxID=414052 RepID=A0A286G3X8_9PROT|nr:hypothetical protein [Caenispirillum bisanense]SOD90192.1 hypothetical protein SAMN05421508_101470 [Caenispirillum bisanense]
MKQTTRKFGGLVYVSEGEHPLTAAARHRRQTGWKGACIIVRRKAPAGIMHRDPGHATSAAATA